MSVSIKYYVGDREVPADQWVLGMQDEIMAHAANAIADQIGSLRCDEHGEHPTVIVTRMEDGNGALSVSGCCEALKAKTEQWLEAHGGERT